MTDLLRILVVVFLSMQAAAHAAWFLAAWTSRRSGFLDGKWLLPGQITITSPLGKVWGLIALGALGWFALAALALIAGLPGWRGVTNIGVILSLVAVFPWTRQSPRGPTVNVIFADLAFLFLLALPVSIDMLGPA